MYNNYSIVNFKKFLDSVHIEVGYRFCDTEPKIKEEYYSMLFTDPREIEYEIPDKDGIPTIEYRQEGERIWDLNVTGSPNDYYFESYTSLEKELMEEMELNLKVATDLDNIESVYNGFVEWLNDRGNRIKYHPEKDVCECDYLIYGENFKKITFQNYYASTIRNFLMELKKRLMLTYKCVIEKLPSNTFEPNLRWEKHDVDLMELIVALKESNSIKIKEGKNNRTDIVNQFEHFFDFKLKDAESKLSRATDRQNTSPFLKMLQDSFIAYSRKKL
jgi:hypothetical protein